METRKLLDNESGTGLSAPYLIESSPHAPDKEVLAFINFVGGSVTLEASADNINYAPIKDGQFTTSEVVSIGLADGSYLRASYAGVTSGLTMYIQPKTASNG